MPDPVLALQTWRTPEIAECPAIDEGRWQAVRGMGGGLILRAEIGPHPHPGPPGGVALVLAKDAPKLRHAPFAIKQSPSPRPPGPNAPRKPQNASRTTQPRIPAVSRETTHAKDDQNPAAQTSAITLSPFSLRG